MKKRISNRTWVSAATVLFVVVALVVYDEIYHMNQVAEPGRSITLPLVSIIEVEPTAQQVSISVFATAQSRYQSQITSQVDGQITYINETMLVGNIVHEGELLVTIEDSLHTAELASANYEFTQAKIALLTEERQANQAIRDWERSNLDQRPSSPLVLRQPQLESARLQLQAAEANVKRAEALLSFTKIKAPFTGVIVDREVDPGENLTVGQPIVNIMATERVDLVAQLDHKQWSLLADSWRDATATVTEIESKRRWDARVRNGGNLFDTETQLRNVYVTIETDKHDDSVILPGQLVRVALPGKTLNNVLLVPESSVTRDSTIWLVESNDRLLKLPVNVVSSTADRLIIDLPPTENDRYRLALHPLSSFTTGQRVKPNLVSPRSKTNQDEKSSVLGAR